MTTKIYHPRRETGVITYTNRQDCFQICVHLVLIWLAFVKMTSRLGFCPVYTFNAMMRYVTSPLPDKCRYEALCRHVCELFFPWPSLLRRGPRERWKQVLKLASRAGGGGVPVGLKRNFSLKPRFENITESTFPCFIENKNIQDSTVALPSVPWKGFFLSCNNSLHQILQDSHVKTAHDSSRDSTSRTGHRGQDSQDRTAGEDSRDDNRVTPIHERDDRPART
jgi:hypothetical protein